MNEIPENLMWHPSDPRLTQPAGVPIHPEREREAEVREALATLRAAREKGILDQPNNLIIWEEDQ
jgi:hypothetical protein